MDDRVRAIDRIERTVDAHPFCPACGSPTEIAVVDGEIRLRCRASALPRGLRERFDAAFQPHLQLVIGELPETWAA